MRALATRFSDRDSWWCPESHRLEVDLDAATESRRQDGDSDATKTSVADEMKFKAIRRSGEEGWKSSRRAIVERFATNGSRGDQAFDGPGLWRYERGSGRQRRQKETARDMPSMRSLATPAHAAENPPRAQQSDEAAAFDAPR